MALYPTRVPSPGLSPATHPTHLTCILHARLPTQVPEDFGPVRTIAEGRGDTLYVGTTRNSILLGSVHTGFSLLVQVSNSGSFRTSFILTATGHHRHHHRPTSPFSLSLHIPPLSLSPWSRKPHIPSLLSSPRIPIAALTLNFPEGLPAF